MLANEIYRSPQTSAAGLAVIAAGVPMYWWMRRGARAIDLADPNRRYSGGRDFPAAINVAGHATVKMTDLKGSILSTGVRT